MSKKERLYNLAEERRVVRRMKDPVDEVLEDEEKELVKEYRRLRLQELIAKRKKEIEKLEGSGEKVKVEGLEVTPAIAKELANLPEDERQKVIETYAALKGAEKLGAAGGFMWPLLIGYAKTNPGAPQDSMVKFAEVMAEQIKTGIELARQNQPQQPQVQYNPVDLIKTFGELIKENVERPMKELVQRVQPQPSTLEKILLDDKLFERFKSLGLFSGGQPQQANPEIQLEIEKLRQERDFKLKEMEQQQQRWMMEQQMQMQRDERRWQVVQNLMQGPLGRVIQTMGGAAAAKISGSQPPKPVLASCPNCGGTFYTSSDAKIAVCPHCNNLLRAAGEGEVEVPPKQEEKTPASSKESK